jgi:hypothetical protein
MVVLCPHILRYGWQAEWTISNQLPLGIWTYARRNILNLHWSLGLASEQSFELSSLNYERKSRFWQQQRCKKCFYKPHRGRVRGGIDVQKTEVEHTNPTHTKYLKLA